MKTLGEIGVLHGGGFIDGVPLLGGKEDLGILHLHGADLPFIRHPHKGSVVNLRHLSPGKEGRDKHIEQEYDQQYDAVIINQWLFG